jgi:predicted ATP-dependent serine protease
MKKFKKIYIEITNICNLNCSFCSKVEKPRKMLSSDEFKTIVEKVKDYTDYIYLHVKGEPLTHPNIIELINIANDYDEYLSWLYGENEDIGIKSGLTNLDNILGKFQAGRMIGIFARTGVGKSTVAIQIDLNMALQKHQIKTL